MNTYTIVQRLRRALRRSDRGLTLAEVMIATGLILTVTAITLSATVYMVRATTTADSRSGQERAVSNGLDRILGDVMLAHPVGVASSTDLQVDVTRITGQCRRMHYQVQSDPAHAGHLRIVSYRADYPTGCDTNTSTPVTGTATVIADDLTAATFSYQDANGTTLATPATVSSVATVTVSVTAATHGPSAQPVTLTSTMELKNR